LFTVYHPDDAIDLGRKVAATKLDLFSAAAGAKAIGVDRHDVSVLGMLFAPMPPDPNVLAGRISLTNSERFDEICK